MNQADRKEFDMIHGKMDDIKKENLFNPHQGLWSETKLNTQYREDSKKWRYPIGVGFITLMIKNIWDTIVG